MLASDAPCTQPAFNPWGLYESLREAGLALSKKVTLGRCQAPGSPPLRAQLPQAAGEVTVGPLAYNP